MILSKEIVLHGIEVSIVSAFSPVNFFRSHGMHFSSRAGTS